MYYERTIEKKLRSISETFPVLMLTGPRQVGKTTLLKRMAEHERKVVSLDNMLIRAQAKRDPEQFIQRYSPPVMIDEIQYAPELLDYIKVYVDDLRVKSSKKYSPTSEKVLPLFYENRG